MSLFILYVHEHDCLGFGMLTVETAVLNPFYSFKRSRSQTLSTASPSSSIPVRG